MKKNPALELLIWAIAAAPFVYLAVLWGQLPPEVPTHFNAAGEPDDYSSKSSLFLIMGFVTLPTNLLIRFLPALDPKQNFDQFPDAFQRLRLVIAIGLAAICCVIVYSATHTGSNPVRILTIVLGGLFAGLGNYMGALKPNYFIGIRTPWTLESPTVWRKTHQMGGRLFFIAGIVTILMALVFPVKSLVFAIALPVLVVSVVTVYYSWRVYQQEKNAS